MHHEHLFHNLQCSWALLLTRAVVAFTSVPENVPQAFDDLSGMSIAAMMLKKGNLAKDRIDCHTTTVEDRKREYSKMLCLFWTEPSLTLRVRAFTVSSGFLRNQHIAIKAISASSMKRALQIVCTTLSVGFSVKFM